jgi:hypothetical protein
MKTKGSNKGGWAGGDSKKTYIMDVRCEVKPEDFGIPAEHSKACKYYAEYVTGECITDRAKDRKHFAAMAMQGLLASDAQIFSTDGKTLLGYISAAAIDYADALLKELYDEN